MSALEGDLERGGQAQLAGLSGPVLAVDASTLQATASIVGRDGSEWGAWRQPEGRRGTALLAPAVSDLLSSGQLAVADLGGVVVGTGPGSYTGLRSSISFARALAWPSRRPLVGLPSVASAAAALFATRPSVQRVVTVVDARRGECYRADYARAADGGCREVRAPCLVSVGEIEALKEDHDLVVLKEPEPLASVLAHLAAARLAAGGDDPATVLPLYLKRSHAEIALEERQR